MKRSALLLVFLFLMCTALISSQVSSTPDPYKPTLDRLESLTRQGETEWRSHADVPHPEDPVLNDSDWGIFTVNNVSGYSDRTSDNRCRPHVDLGKVRPDKRDVLRGIHRHHRIIVVHH